MKLALSIALSHLLARRRQTVVSLMGIGLGVAFFLATSSMMSGSVVDFITRLVDNAPHVTIYDEHRNPQPQPATETFPQAVVELRSLKPRGEVRGIRQYKEKLAFIAAIPNSQFAPMLTGQAIVTFAGKDLSVTVNGIIPELMNHITTLDKHFITGSLEALSVNSDGIVIGAELANKFRVAMGQNLTVTSTAGVVRTMKIVGIFRTGNASVDESQAFIILKRAQSLLNRSNIANRIVLKLADPNTAPEVARMIEATIGYKAQSWQEATSDIMSVLKMQNAIMYGVVSAILIVASFGIYNIISTVVMEKTRDIAILKSIGFHARDIQRVFLIEGAIVGMIGSTVGTGIGLLMMLGISYVKFKSQFQSEETYMPVYWGWEQVATGAGFAIASALAAAYLPARKGGRVHPVDILRGAA